MVGSETLHYMYGLCLLDHLNETAKIDFCNALGSTISFDVGLWDLFI